MHIDPRSISTQAMAAAFESAYGKTNCHMYGNKVLPTDELTFFKRDAKSAEVVSRSSSSPELISRALKDKRKGVTEALLWNPALTREQQLQTLLKLLEFNRFKAVEGFLIDAEDFQLASDLIDACAAAGKKLSASFVFRVTVFYMLQGNADAARRVSEQDSWHRIPIPSDFVLGIETLSKFAAMRGVISDTGYAKVAWKLLKAVETFEPKFWADMDAREHWEVFCKSLVGLEAPDMMRMPCQTKEVWSQMPGQVLATYCAESGLATTWMSGVQFLAGPALSNTLRGNSAVTYRLNVSQWQWDADAYAAFLAADSTVKNAVIKSFSYGNSRSGNLHKAPYEVLELITMETFSMELFTAWLQTTHFVSCPDSSVVLALLSMADRLMEGGAEQAARMFAPMGWRRVPIEDRVVIAEALESHGAADEMHVDLHLALAYKTFGDRSDAWSLYMSMSQDWEGSPAELLEVVSSLLD